MRNEEIITRLDEIKRRAKSQKRDQCVTIILAPDGFVKMFDASGTVKKQKGNPGYELNRKRILSKETEKLKVREIKSISNSVVPKKSKWDGYLYNE